MTTTTTPTPRDSAPPSISFDDLLTVEQLAEESDGRLTLGAIRWQLYHRETNGLNVACVRLGRRVYISRTRYQQWLATQLEVRE